MSNWMIYGAYGYTGVLVAEEALKRGHTPILAGRSADKLIPLAERLNLPHKVFGLDDPATIESALDGVDVVYHAAGPFVHTSDPMIRACINTNTHYLDITGEYPVFENTFSYDEQAKAAGIALISGVGFDVVPTDCAAKHVVNRLPDADKLEIGFAAIGTMSAGTAKSAIGLMGSGGKIRRDGDLIPFPMGKGARTINFYDKPRTALPITWGDLSTAYRSTGVPNITTYMAFPKAVANMMGTFGGVSSAMMSSELVRGVLRKMVDWTVTGPDENTRNTATSHVWAKATNPAGEGAETWIETIEAYHYTALIGVRSVEQMLDSAVTGTSTPSLAFGVDFVLEVEGTQRFDSKP